MKSKAQEIADKQVEDPGLWFVAETASEEYLQAALRLLHAAVEKDSRDMSKNPEKTDTSGGCVDAIKMSFEGK